MRRVPSLQRVWCVPGRAPSCVQHSRRRCRRPSHAITYIYLLSVAQHQKFTSTLTTRASGKFWHGPACVVYLHDCTVHQHGRVCATDDSDFIVEGFFLRRVVRSTSSVIFGAWNASTNIDLSCSWKEALCCLHHQNSTATFVSNANIRTRYRLDTFTNVDTGSVNYVPVG